MLFLISSMWILKNLSRNAQIWRQPERALRSAASLAGLFGAFVLKL